MKRYQKNINNNSLRNDCSSSVYRWLNDGGGDDDDVQDWFT